MADPHRVGRHRRLKGSMRTNVVTQRIWYGEHFVHSSDHIGESLPRHLQVAFGRAVFRLLHGWAEPRLRPAWRESGLTNGLIYLRDLPLNLCDLERRGYPHALAAYRSECRRVGIAPIPELS